MGGCKTYGGRKTYQTTRSPENFWTPPKELLVCSVVDSCAGKTEHWHLRGVENVPHEGGPQPLLKFGRGVIREGFHPPLFSTPLWRPLTYAEIKLRSFTWGGGFCAIEFDRNAAAMSAQVSTDLSRGTFNRYTKRPLQDSAIIFSTGTMGNLHITAQNTGFPANSATPRVKNPQIFPLENAICCIS